MEVCNGVVQEKIMNNISGNNRSIAVLGMHRSGTSTITRALNLLGVYLGEERDLVPPYPENPEGFWERLDVIDLQERLLASLNRSWDTCMPLPEGWHFSSEVKPYRDELITFITRTFSEIPLWGWKDPRSTLLFELWKDVLAECGTAMSIVFVVRNPLDVAKSLGKRNGFHLDKGYGIWFNYNITALRAIAGLPVTFISYDSFLNDWETELRRCSSELHITWPQDDSELHSTMKAFIRPDLCHSCTTAEDLIDAGTPQPVLALYDLLNCLLNGKADSKTIYRALTELYDIFYDYSRFYLPDLIAAYDPVRQLLKTKQQLDEYDHLLAQIKQQLSERNAQVNELSSSSIAADAQIKELTKRMQDLLNSKSWKATKLLRKLHGFLKKKNVKPPDNHTKTPATANNTYCNDLLYSIISGRFQKKPVAPHPCSVDIIIPVYNAFELTQTCISSVLKNSNNCRVILCNDASTDPKVRGYLDSIQSIPERNVEVIVSHSEVNQGFLKTVNDAYLLTQGHFVILNSDTEVPSGWLDRLFAPIFSSPRTVASVTPFTNAAMGWLGCNFPDSNNDTEIFENMPVEKLDSFFREYSLGVPIEIFSGGGFCMAFNRLVVDKIGLFDHDTFGKGYCEEVDWSLRAFDEGYKNVLASDLFVYHKHGASFNQKEKQELQSSNLNKLLSKHTKHSDRMSMLSENESVQAVRETVAIIAGAHIRKDGERRL